MSEKNYYQSNYIFLCETLAEDLRQIGKNIERLKILDANRDIDENLHKKYRDLSAKNKDARTEISVFLSEKLDGYAKDKAAIDFAGRKNDEALMLLFKSEYHYGIYSRYYDPDYDFSTETKIRALPFQFLEMESRVCEFIELKKVNAKEYYQRLDREFGLEELLKKNSALVEVHDVLKKRATIFKSLVKLYTDNDWAAFIALASLQVEGLFYDCCEILKEKDLSGTAGTFVEKVDKAFSGNQIMMLYAYPYFKYEMPLLRNTIAHVGTIEGDEETLQNLVWDLILDINALVLWNYQLSREKYTVVSMLHDEVHKEVELENKINTLITSMLSCMSVADFKYLQLLKDVSQFQGEIELMKCEEGFWESKIEHIRSIIDTEIFWDKLTNCIDENDVLQNKPYNIVWLADRLANTFIKVYENGSAEKTACAKAMAKVNNCKNN